MPNAPAPLPQARQAARRLALTLSVLLCAACSPIRSGSPANPQLTGHWVLDNTQSDDVSAKIDHAVADAEARWHKRHPPGSGSLGGPAVGAGGNLEDEYGTPVILAPDWRELRGRLRLALSPPKRLQFEVEPDFVRITPDNIPPIEYHPDEVFSRIDEYGTASIDSGWADKAFVLQLRYEGGATRLERYAPQAHGATLLVTRSLNDSQAGKIEIHSTYRRG